MANVLERLGWQVDVPPAQTCCGQPAFNAGYRAEARAVALHNLRSLAGSRYVVVPSGSCTSMITHQYLPLVEDDPVARANLESLQVFEFSEFLLRVANADDVGASLRATATYHDGCHALRELGLKDGPRRLLKRVRGLELREMEPAEECCGFGGSFSIKFADVSAKIADSKVEAITRTGADIVVSADSSCLMQIEGRLRRAGSPTRTMHLAEVLAAR